MADAYICRRGGGSGGDSELVIVGGTTRPAKPTQNMIWVDTDKEITDVVLCAEHTRENLLVSTAVKETINGVDFVVYSDGTILVNGTATDSVYYKVSSTMSLADGDYILSGCPEGGGSTFALYVNGDGIDNIFDYGSGAQLPTNASALRNCRIVIYKGYTANNLIFHPRISRSSESGDMYESLEEVDEGAVWVTLANSGRIKVVSPVGGDWITIYPISAKQYVNGAWVDRAAKSYQNGAWVDWFTYFLNGDSTFEEITGGWESYKHTDGYSLGTAAFGSYGLSIEADNGYAVCVATKGKISLKNSTKILVSVESAVITQPSTFCLYLSDAKMTSANTDTGYVAKFQLMSGLNEIAIPAGVSNGVYYLSVGLYTYSTGKQTITIDSVSLR